jgi:hypothetical protein
LIEDDPGYAVGERHLLFLIEGPQVDGQLTKVVLAPEGRYRVARRYLIGPATLRPVTGRGFAKQVAGKKLSAVEIELANLDTDSDGTADAKDNCPTHRNAGQVAPSWSVPRDDVDCDGFSNRVDQYTGRSPLVACPATATADDEIHDAWPPDFNDDQRVDAKDATALRAVLNSRLGSEAVPGDARYEPRMDLNADFVIDQRDMEILTAFLGKSCSP